MSATLQRIARLNGGFFTRGEALDSGESDLSLRAGRKAKVLLRLRHGAYAFAADVTELDEVARHLLLVRAALRNQQGSVALTGPSAAALHGFRLYGHDLDQVHLVRLDGGSPRREAGIVHRRVTQDIADEVTVVDGLPTISAARAVWEVARTSGLESGVATADSALQLQPELLDELEALGQRYRNHPGSRTARLVIHLADGRAESVGESVTRVQCYRYAVPMPDLQFDVVVDGQVVGTADFYWEQYCHVAEFDGKVKYQKYLRPGESPSDCAFREKRREDRIRGGMLGMTRIVWAEIMPSQARQTMSGLVRDLERSRSLYLPRRLKP